MPKALILVADGSEEIEFVTPYDGMSCRALQETITLAIAKMLMTYSTVLTRAGFEVTSAGVSLKNEAYAQLVAARLQ